MFRPEHNYKDFFAGAVLGGTLGAISALMFTEKGKQIQKELMHKYHEFGDHFVHYQKSKAHKVRRSAKRVARRVSKKARSAKKK